MVKHHVSMRFRTKWQASVNCLSAGDCKGLSPSGLGGEFSLVFWVGKGDSYRLKSSISLPFREQIKKISSITFLHNLFLFHFLLVHAQNVLRFS